MSGDGERLVVLGVPRDEIEAAVWRDALAQEGIAVHVQSGDPMAPFGVPPQPGSLQVLVRAEDERRARWLLGEATTSS